jgi:hypothetical protein
MVVAYMLAYCDMATITAVISFIVQAPRDISRTEICNNGLITTHCNSSKRLKKELLWYSRR